MLLMIFQTLSIIFDSIESHLSYFENGKPYKRTIEENKD